jgi:hypothetical protein
MGKLIVFWLRRHLKQGRILAIYLLAFVLFLLSAVVYTTRYQADLDSRNTNNQLLENTIEGIENADQLSATLMNILMPASPERFVVDNNLDEMPVSRGMNPLLMQLPQNVGGRRVEFIGLWDIDLAFLVGVIFSFLAVVMTFDAVSGEKEGGTLRLLLSNSVPRYQIVLSKIIAAGLTIGIPLLLGLVINCLVLNFTGVITFDLEQAFVLVSFIILSAVLLFFYCALGVLISSLNRNSITSLVILLLLWVALVVFVPGASRPIARELVYVKKQEELSAEINSHWRVFFTRYHEVGAWDRSYKVAKADGFKKEYKWGGIRDVLLNSIQNSVDSHLRDMYAQAELARSISRLSPNMVYKFAVSEIAGTGYLTVKDFYTQAGRYKRTLFNFLKNQDALDSESPHIYGSQGRGYLSLKPLSAEIPRFVFSKASMAARLRDILVDSLILFTLAACAVLGCIFVFNRYDVR